MSGRWRPTPRRLGLVVVLVAALPVASCSGDDAGDDSSAVVGETVPPRQGAAGANDEEPPGTDPAAVEPHIERLLESYDEITGQIVADARIRSDPDHALYGRLADVMAPGSAPATLEIEGLSVGYPDGSYQLPYVEGDLPVRRRLDGPLQTVSANQVSFPVCTRFDYRVYDGLGRQTEFSQGSDVPGRGAAQRIDGEWRISELEIDYGHMGCAEGSG